MATKKEVAKKTTGSSPSTSKKASSKTIANKSSIAKKEVVTEKYINPKNYLYAFLILVGGILLALYIFEWYNVKKEAKLSTSYLVTTSTIESSITDLNSLNQIRQETASDYFIYLSYTKDESVYNLEKSLKRIIDKYKLNDIFYYVNLTEMKENNADYIKEINNDLGIDKLQKLPAILFVKEGKIVEVLDGINDTNLTADHFQKLLDNYEFETIN